MAALAECIKLERLLRICRSFPSSFNPTYETSQLQITVPSGMVMNIDVEPWGILISSDGWGSQRFEFRYYETFEKTMEVMMATVRRL